MTTKKEVGVEKLMRDDLAKSGLSTNEIEARAIEPGKLREILGRFTKQATGIDFGAAQFSYRDVNRKPIADHAALRLYADKQVLARLGLPKYYAFDPSARDYKTANLSPRFYLSVLFDFEWASQDVQQDLYFTEGQKKAACACKLGLGTIGLEGVDNFRRKVKESVFGGRSKSRSVVIDDFDLFAWVRRNVVICYDSDIDFKPEVRDAALRLAGELIRRGARVYYVRLACDCKVPCKGLDDFLVKHGRDAFLALKREPFDQVEMLSANYLKLAKPPATFYDREMRTLMNFQKFLVHTASIRTVSADGNSISAADRWNEETVVYTRLLFEPTAAPQTLIADPEFDGRQGFNTFDGLFCEPRRGDIGLYLKLLEKLFPDAKTRKRFEQWAAWPLQNLGAKINWAWLLHSRVQGSGKTFLGRMVGGLYGSAFCPVNKPEELHRKFNAIFESKLFLLANEIIRSQVEAERLKGLVTEGEMDIERKGIDRYKMPNRMNIFASSNHPDALEITKEDRRWSIHEVLKWWSSPEERDEFFTALAKWWYADPRRSDSLPRVEAAAALLYHLQSEVDCAGFKSYGDAPMSEAKRAMIEATEHDEVVFARVLAEEPLAALGKDYRYALRFEVLFKRYLDYSNRQWAKDGDAKKLRAALKNRGFEYLAVQKRNIGITRLWIVDANWRKGKSSTEIFDYHTSNPCAYENAPFVLKGQEPTVPGKVVNIR